MSEERFVAIERGLAHLTVKVETLEVKVDVLDLKVDALDTKVNDLGATVANVSVRLRDLDRGMRVLHEDTIANIRALAPDPEEFERKFTAADDKLRQEIARRLDPLEAFARTRGFEGPAS